MRRILLVGESPPTLAHARLEDPLTGPCTRWLAKVCEMDHAVFLERTVRVNVFNRPVRSWNKRGAEHRLGKILLVNPYRVVVLLGRRVQAASGIRLKHPLGHVADVGKTRIIFCPHPSGRCRWWNDPINRVRAKAVFEYAFYFA